MCGLFVTKISQNASTINEWKDPSSALVWVRKNLFGPMKVVSVRRWRFFLTVMDEYSGYSLVWFTYRKTETRDNVIEIVRELKIILSACTETFNWIDRKFVKWLQSHRGGEYDNNSFQNWLKQQRIIHQVKNAYPPESDGREQCWNGTHICMARTMFISDTFTRKNLWAETINEACCFRNPSITRSNIPKCTPCEAIHRRKLSIGWFRKFDCKAVVYKHAQFWDG